MYKGGMPFLPLVAKHAHHAWRHCNQCRILYIRCVCSSFLWTFGLQEWTLAWAEHRTGRHCVDVAATCETTLPILQEMEDATKIMFRPPDEVHVSWTIHLIDLA